MGCSVVLCTVMTSSSCSPSRKHAVGVLLSPPLAAPRAAVFAAPRLVAARAFSTGSLDLVLRQADSALADVAKAKALIMAAKWNDLDAEELEDMAAGVGRSVSACMSLSFPYPLLFSLFSLALSCCRPMVNPGLSTCGAGNGPRCSFFFAGRGDVSPLLPGIPVGLWQTTPYLLVRNHIA